MSACVVCLSLRDITLDRDIITLYPITGYISNALLSILESTLISLLVSHATAERVYL